MSKATLEAERAALKVEIDAFQFPCPDCGRHVGKIPWDKKKGGECPHCLAHIEPKDFQMLTDALSRTPGPTSSRRTNRSVLQSVE